MAVRSERGTVTAELAVALPAVLMVLTFSVQVLSMQVERVSLAGQAATMARMAARGEAVSGAINEGKLICVTKEVKLLMPIHEKQCARRLGL